MLAAGVLGISALLMNRVYESGAGCVVTKSVGPRPRLGHLNPTAVTVSAGLLNGMGLPNPGAEYMAKEVSLLRNKRVPFVASVFGHSTREYPDVARKLADAGANAIEVNCSCPNANDIGLLGQDPEAVEQVTRSVKEAVDVPVFVKLTPLVNDIAGIARAAEDGGADAVTAINTMKAMAVDIETGYPILSNITGGLSGSALKPIALRCVWEIFEAVSIPVIGCGGICNWEDAVEFLLCGASAVQIGTSVMTEGLEVFSNVTQGISKYLERNGLKQVGDIVGKAH